MKRALDTNVVADLYRKCEQEVAASEARSVRDKITERDLRRAKFAMEREIQRGVRPTLDHVTALINDTKAGPFTISKSTLSRHLAQAKVEFSNTQGDFPKKVDLSSWLASRRSFCDKFKKADKSRILVGDEAFFGFKERVHQKQAEWHIAGHQPIKVYEPWGAKRRVSVWAAVGLDYYTPLIIFEDGKHLTGEDYNRMMDKDVIPILEEIGTGVTLIEDNWPTHKTEQGEINFREHHIIHKFLPPWSPDLSWIEKVWANLARRVYANGRVYRSKEELTTVLKAEWEQLVGDFDYRRRLVVQAEAACKKVIDHQGYRVHWD